MPADAPILPAHIEDTIQAIAKLHADHRRSAGSLQRLVDRLTACIGRPTFLAAMTATTAAWVCANIVAAWSGFNV